jgi:hypothetical protein
VPGTLDGLVASQVGYQSVVVYDAGRVRPERVDGKICAGLIYAGEGTSYFGFNNMDTGWQLYELLVTDKGIRVVQEHPNVINQFGVNIAAGGGRIYVSNGVVYDFTAKKALARLPGVGDIAIDTTNRRAYQVRPESLMGHQVTVFDWDSVEPRASYLVAQTIPIRDSVKLKLTLIGSGALPMGRRYLGRNCKPVLLLGESGLAINCQTALTFVPTAEILKADRK